MEYYEEIKRSCQLKPIIKTSKDKTPKFIQISLKGKLIVLTGFVKLTWVEWRPMQCLLKMMLISTITNVHLSEVNCCSQTLDNTCLTKSMQKEKYNVQELCRIQNKNS